MADYTLVAVVINFDVFLSDSANRLGSNKIIPSLTMNL